MAVRTQAGGKEPSKDISCAARRTLPCQPPPQKGARPLLPVAAAGTAALLFNLTQKRRLQRGINFHHFFREYCVCLSRAAKRRGCLMIRSVVVDALVPGEIGIAVPVGKRIPVVVVRGRDY